MTSLGSKFSSILWSPLVGERGSRWPREIFICKHTCACPHGVTIEPCLAFLWQDQVKRENDFVSSPSIYGLSATQRKPVTASFSIHKTLLTIPLIHIKGNGHFTVESWSIKRTPVFVKWSTKVSDVKIQDSVVSRWWLWSQFLKKFVPRQLSSRWIPVSFRTLRPQRRSRWKTKWTLQSRLSWERHVCYPCVALLPSSFPSSPGKNLDRGPGAPSCVCPSVTSWLAFPISMAQLATSVTTPWTVSSKAPFLVSSTSVPSSGPSAWQCTGTCIWWRGTDPELTDSCPYSMRSVGACRHWWLWPLYALEALDTTTPTSRLGGAGWTWTTSSTSCGFCWLGNCGSSAPTLLFQRCTCLWKDT